MTKAQKKWLEVLKREGFIPWGSWGCGQRNRPLRALIKMGYAREELGPRGDFLKVQGVELKDA